MPTQDPMHFGAHSAVLSLDFSLLQHVVSCYLLPEGHPVPLTGFSPITHHRYQAELTGCHLLPASPNQCALTVEFGNFSAHSSTAEYREQQVELTCLVELRTAPAPDGTGDRVMFDYHLLVEGGLRFRQRPGTPFADCPELHNDSLQALLPELQALLYTRLRVDLCRLADYARSKNDAAAIWGASIQDVQVVAGPLPRLDLYYEASEGEYAFGPPPPPLDQTKTYNAALLVSNEHLLRKLVLPSLRHLFEDYRVYAPPGVSEADLTDARDEFAVEPVHGRFDGAMQATNLLPLRPVHTGYPAEAPPVLHYVNAGDLTVVMDGKTHVTIIYTLLPADPDAKHGKLAIKIRQSYTFGPLLRTTGTLFDCELEHTKLDVWGVTTDKSSTLTEHADFISRFVNRHAARQVINDLVATVLMALPRFGRRPLPRADMLGAAPSAPPTELAPLGESVRVELPFYQVKEWHPFLVTIPPELLLNSSPPVKPLLGAGSSGSYVVMVNQEPALAELNRLLVEWRVAENPILDFCTNTLPDLMLGMLVKSDPVVSAIYDFTMGFASHFLGLTAKLQQTWLHFTGVETTTTAVLARLFYGAGYLEGTTRQKATRRSLETLFLRAFLPLAAGKSSSFVDAQQSAAGLQVQLLVDVSKLVVPPMPATLERPPDAPQPAGLAAPAPQYARYRHERRFQLDWEKLNHELDDFFGLSHPA